MNVLLAPAAGYFGADAVSENRWMYNLVSVLERADLEFLCFAEDVGEVGTLSSQIEKIGPRRHETMGGIALPFRVAKRSWSSVSVVDIVHHGLPFAIGWTVSALPALTRRRRVPFVIGPVQALQIWTGVDERPLSRIDSIVRTATKSASSLVSRLARMTLEAADRIVAAGDIAKDALLAAGARPEQLTIIPPFAFSEVPITHRTNAAGSEDNIRVVMVGRLIKRKAVDQALTALSSMDQALRIKLTVVGDGPERPYLETLTRRLRLNDVVRFVGWLDPADLRAEMSRSDVYLNTSLSEGWGGQALVEAMAAGLAPVVTPTAGAMEVVRPFVTGIVTDSFDPAAIAAALDQLCSSRRELGATAGRAANWVQTELSPQKLAGDWLRVYSEAIAVYS